MNSYRSISGAVNFMVKGSRVYTSMYITGV